MSWGNKKKGHKGGLCDFKECEKVCKFGSKKDILSCPWRAKNLGVSPEGLTVIFAEPSIQ